MKTLSIQPVRSNSRMSIEIFDAKLLKETNLMDYDDFVFEKENDSDEESETGIEELSFKEFEETL